MGDSDKKTKINNNSDDQLIILKATIGVNKQYFYEKIKKLTVDLTVIIASITDEIKFSKSSPDQKYSPKTHYFTTVFPANMRDPPLEVEHYKKLVA